jgi:hypothetical protein
MTALRQWTADTSVDEINKRMAPRSEVTEGIPAVLDLLKLARSARKRVGALLEENPRQRGVISDLNFG